MIQEIENGSLESALAWARRMGQDRDRARARWCRRRARYLEREIQVLHEQIDELHEALQAGRLIGVGDQPSPRSSTSLNTMGSARIAPE